MNSAAPPEPRDPPEPLPAVVLFIDRDTWSHVLDGALRDAGIPFVAHRAQFEPATPDIEWIAEVGKRGWVIVTCDKNIRRRPNELKAVQAVGARLFALTSGNLSAADTAHAVIKAWPAIQREVARTPAPALYSVSRTGEVRRLLR